MTPSHIGARLGLGLVLAASTFLACSSAGTAPPSASATAEADAGVERAAPKPQLQLEFVAGYPATLLYALEGAAGARNHDANYRSWLIGDGKPQWLADYSARRDLWRSEQKPDAGGGAAAFDVCSWTATTLQELKTCLEAIVPVTDRAILNAALDETDRRLSPKWPLFEARFARLMPELEAALATDDADELLGMLRREASLPDDATLAFKVVLVGKPPSNHTFARQAGQYLVHEVDEKSTSGGLLGVAFHEIAHLAHFMSPRRHELERSLMALGDSGRLTASYWDEIVASAFGNGLAAERFDPAFRVNGSFYDDRLIDRLGRALFLKWRSGLDVRLGPTLAQELVRLLDDNWSADERPVSRYLTHLTVRAEQRASLDGALDGIVVRSAYLRTPIDDAMAAEDDLPPWAARIALATADDLAAHPALLKRVGLPEGTWTAALDGHRAAVFRRTDPDGTVLFVIAAKDTASLTTALPDFARQPRMVQDGWTSW